MILVQTKSKKVLYETYFGEKRSDQIVRWTISQVSPPLEEISTEEELDKMLSSSNFVLVGFFSESISQGNSNIQPILVCTLILQKEQKSFFFKLSSVFVERLEKRKVSVAFTNSPRFSTMQKVKLLPTLRLYQKNTDPVSTLFQFSVEDMFKWVEENTAPVIEEINTETFQEKIQSKKTLALFFLDYSEERNKEFGINLSNMVARKFSPQIQFVYADGENHRIHVQKFGCSGKKIPSLLVQVFSTSLHYCFPDERDFNFDSVVEFIQSVRDKAIQPSFASGLTNREVQELENSSQKSEEEKEILQKIRSDRNRGVDNIAMGSVIELVANKWIEVVAKSNANVVVNYYVNWCQFCSQLDPIWTILASKFSNRTDIIFARMDVDSNELPDEQIFGLPTIKFYPVNAKWSPVHFSGREKSESALEKWLISLLE